MDKQPLGLAFDEAMTGGFTLGATDPARGASEGRVAGTAASIHNTIVVPDLAAFYDDDAHCAKIGVRFDFTPFGTGIEGTGGTFNLFESRRDPRIKQMVYRFGFSWQGKPHLFLGKKYIHDGVSLVKLWDETTHLYSRIYEGEDETGAVIGAGVLEVGLHGIIAFVRSMCATNAASKEQAAEAVARFGEFFLGELWETYSSHWLHMFG